MRAAAAVAGLGSMWIGALVCLPHECVCLVYSISFFPRSLPFTISLFYFILGVYAVSIGGGV